MFYIRYSIKGIMKKLKFVYRHFTYSLPVVSVGRFSMKYVFFCTYWPLIYHFKLSHFYRKLEPEILHALCWWVVQVNSYKKHTHTLIGLGKIMSIVVLYLVCQQVRIARNSWMHKLNSYTQLSNEKDVFPKPLTLDSCGHLAHGLAALVWIHNHIRPRCALFETL